MAKLSERTHEIFMGRSLPQHIIITGTITNEENTMTLRTINLTLIDNNPNLKTQDKIVFQELNYITEHTDQQAQQMLLMTGKVSEALEKHNSKRVETVDKDILRNTGKKVFLEPVEIFDLQWQVVRVA